MEHSVLTVEQSALIDVSAAEHRNVVPSAVKKRTNQKHPPRRKKCRRRLNIWKHRFILVGILTVVQRCVRTEEWL